MNNLVKFCEWSSKNGYGKVQIPNNVMEIFTKYLDECEVNKLKQVDVMISANCYNELKAFLQEKKKSPRLCAWDSVHHEEIWDKMLEFEQKYS